jgi:hypothetical protein
MELWEWILADMSASGPEALAGFAPGWEHQSSTVDGFRNTRTDKVAKRFGTGAVGI